MKRQDLQEQAKSLMRKSGGTAGESNEATKRATKAQITKWLDSFWSQWARCLAATPAWTRAMGGGWIMEHTEAKGVIETILSNTSAGRTEETLPVFVTIVQPPHGSCVVCFRENECNIQSFSAARKTRGCVISMLIDLGRNEAEAAD